MCQSSEDRVVDSRPLKDGRAIRRRRQCVACNHRFTTYEYIEGSALQVIKHDGRREQFDRSKVMHGVRLACTKRPIATGRLEELVDRVETRLFEGGGLEVDARRIGELIMDELRELDEVAYVRFASVYREFQDRDAFLALLDHLDEGDDGVPPASRAPSRTHAEPEK